MWPAGLNYNTGACQDSIAPPPRCPSPIAPLLLHLQIALLPLQIAHMLVWSLPILCWLPELSGGHQVQCNKCLIETYSALSLKCLYYSHGS